MYLQQFLFQQMIWNIQINCVSVRSMLIRKQRHGRFNVMFAMLDWYNFGLSFIIGLIWIWAYKKSGHLIFPMIAHGGINIISLIYWILVTQ